MMPELRVYSELSEMLPLPASVEQVLPEATV